MLRNDRGLAAEWLPTSPVRFAGLAPRTLALLVVLDPRRRAIHDLVAGTVMLQLPYRGTMWPNWFW